MRLFFHGICAFVWMALAGAPADAAKRIAFAVGIDRYDNLSSEQQLGRAVADARSMARTFKELQFEVVDGENLSRESFLIAWQRFLGMISPGDTAAVFFAGHGIEMRGANYLMPRDVPSAAKGELVLRGAALPLSDILDLLDERKPGTALVILDACRNNPFSASGRTIGGARGLARVDERPGTLILYSAGIGQVALDHVPGEPAADNSVFTHTLVPLLKTPGLDLLDVAIQTQRRVDALARHESHTQTPAFYSQLLRDVYLAGAPATPAPSTIPGVSSQTLEAEIARRIEAERKRWDEERLRRRAERKKLADAARPPTPAVPTGPTPPARGQPEAEKGEDAAIGTTSRGWIGVKIQSVTQEIASSKGLPEASGALISEIVAGGPAEAADLKAGDVITAINGERVAVPKDLARKVADIRPGMRAAVAFIRDGQSHMVAVAVGQFPARAAPDATLKAGSQTPSGSDPALAVRPGSGRSFRDCPSCPEMVVVPAGSFTMGSPESEEGRRNWEGPRRQVKIAAPFAVGRYEVTFAEWDACVADGGCNGHRPDDKGWGRDRLPVINVNWDHAKAYVAWLSRTTGRSYRLLTEAEWEYVARAGSATPFSTGRTIASSQANFDDRSNDVGNRKGVHRGRTVAVDSFAANAWGLHNVHGNVHEWVEDCGNRSYAGVPTDGSAWTTGDCSHRIVRSGSWHTAARHLRSASRFRYPASSRDVDLGLRVGRALTP